MNKGTLKTTMWYKCLVCQRCFQFPTALVVHRMKSQCRFQYKEIHKERSKWPFETPLLENLDKETSRLKESQKFLKAPKAIDEAQEPNEAKESHVPKLSEKSINSDLNQVMSCDVNPLPRNEEQSKYNCYFCSSLFTNFEDLKNHMVYHTREKPAERKSGSFNYFDNCKEDGMRSDEVKLHKTSAKFICNLCEKKYCSKHYFNLHISTVHKKLKPHSCKQCPKSFSHISSLRTHISIVHDRLKLNCKQCSKTFGTKQNLRIHISAVHQGIKPFSCKQCEKAFSTKQNLKVHISRRHKP